MTLPRNFICLLAAVTVLITLPASAHESPEHDIEHLTDHIKSHRTPQLLFQRAIAYRALGQLKNALSDLNSAVSLAPENLTYQIELSRTYLVASKFGRALNAAEKALELGKTPADRAVCHVLRAEALHGSQQYKLSLAACQLAFSEIPKGEIEWFLLRSENQAKLGLHKLRITHLKAGLVLHRSAVLKTHWIDAIIDAGEYKTALPLIEAELADRRWKSHWQIKQARALIGLGRQLEAQKHLTAALQEINGRLNPTQPDILILADLAHIYFLTGDMAAAKTSMMELKKHRAPAWVTSRLESYMSKK